MATERQSPDAIAAQSGFGSCAVGDIDDDPDSPDGLWCVASGNNVNTAVRTSFPTPTGDPTIGADLQEFKAWVKQFDTGQSGDPDARIELWENGGLVRAGSDIPITGAGQMITFTWNANELATADGSLVEMKVVGTKSGGSPSARNTVDVGAVEWNVDYSAFAIVEGAALLTGSGSLSADALALVPAGALITGTGALSADALALVPAAAALSGSGALTGDALLLVPATAALTGVGALTADALAQVPASALISGVGALTGDALLIVPATAALSGVGALIADGVVIGGGAIVEGAAALSGVGALVADSLALVSAVAALSGVGGLQGDAFVIIPASTILSGAGVLIADGDIFVPAVIEGATFLIGIGSLLASGRFIWTPPSTYGLWEILAGEEPVPVPSGYQPSQQPGKFVLWGDDGE